MYRVKIKGKTVKLFGRTKFANYEAARQAVRRYIRQTLSQKQYNHAVDVKHGSEFGWDGISRGPTNFTCLGFSIVQA
jgi:hypothetical protein